MTRRIKVVARWTAGIAATVVAGLVLALLIAIARTTISNKIQQASSDAATRVQIAELTSQIAELRTELAGTAAVSAACSKSARGAALDWSNLWVYTS